MAFTPRLNSNGMAGNPWWYSNGNPFYAAGVGLPNCTCYAYGRYAEIRNNFAPLPTGNAGDWWATVDRTIFKTGQTPQLGAICCYVPDPNTSYLGHVSVVEEIAPDGTLTTSNSAYGGYYWELKYVSPANNYRESWMISRGYTFAGFIYNDAVNGRVSNPYVVAAIAGCFQRESTVNPGIWESLTPTTFDHQYNYDGIGGYGLAQWTNVGTPYGRCWNLHEWVTQNGYQDGDGEGQLAFMLHEGYWTGSAQTHLSYTSLDEFLDYQATASDLPDLVWDFLANYEGMPGDNYLQRLQAAEHFASYIIDHQNDDPSNYSWISSNAYLSTAQMDNNVMCMYFYLTAGTPIPTPKKKKKGMPLWMMLQYNLSY